VKKYVMGKRGDHLTVQIKMEGLDSQVTMGVKDQNLLELHAMDKGFLGYGGAGGRSLV